MNKRIYLGGVSGVGKTTILNKTIKNKKYRVTDIGRIMLEKSETIDKKEGLNSLPPYKRINLRKRAFQKEFEEANNPDTIFDGHYAVPSQIGYEFGIPKTYWGKMDSYILVEATPRQVKARRIKDMKNKKRRIDLDEIKANLQVEKIYAKLFSTKSNKELHCIKNKGLDSCKETLEERLS